MTDTRTFAQAISLLPRAFRPERAGREEARVHIAVTGPEPGNWMVTVREGRCVVETGALPGLDSVIHVPSDVWVEIIYGGLSAEQALAEGLIYFTGGEDGFRRLQSWFE